MTATRLRRGSRAATTTTGDYRTDEIVVHADRLIREIGPELADDCYISVFERIEELAKELGTAIEEVDVLGALRDLQAEVADYLRGLSTPSDLTRALGDSGGDNYLPEVTRDGD